MTLKSPLRSGPVPFGSGQTRVPLKFNASDLAAPSLRGELGCHYSGAALCNAQSEAIVTIHEAIVKTVEVFGVSPCSAAENARLICGERDALAQGEKGAVLYGRAGRAILAGSYRSLDTPGLI